MRATLGESTMRQLFFVGAAIGLLAAGPAPAQTVTYVGQIMPIGTQGWCPNGWLPATGQLMPINQSQALFHVIGTTYGGDGKTTFALPNLKDAKIGSAPVTWCIATTGTFPTQ